MKTKAMAQKILYVILFTGIIIANISSVLYGVDVFHPLFIAGVLIALIGADGLFLLAHPTFLSVNLYEKIEQ